MRSWRFPQKSIFDYACEIGVEPIADLLVNLRLPQLFHSLTYQAQRRNFMQAVRWNRINIVQTLVSSAAPGNAAIETTTGNHFLNFLEAGVECAVSRGLEDMAIYLVSQWQGIKENGCECVTPSAFAFQFASVFHVACIRNLPKLLEKMIERGGEELVEFHLNEGPALTYAFAFGNTEIAALLLRKGADPSIPTATYSVPSVRKWVEFGSPKNVQVFWQSKTISDKVKTKRPPFIGPLDTYEPPTLRLPVDELCRMFADISCGGDRTADPRDAISMHTETLNSGIGEIEQLVEAETNEALDVHKHFDSQQKEELRPGELPDAGSLGDGGINSLELSNNDEGKYRQMGDKVNDIPVVSSSTKSGEEGGQTEDAEPAETTLIEHTELNNDTKAVE
ncbi:hypothetical protein PF003_g2031 [Phytophthora fragariae]|nr:hypothetical protein PF003_g2031 [Phytophthora fragariae]